MTDTSVQATIHERIDPVLEAMISGLVESASQPETSAQIDAAVTQALAGALLATLTTQRIARPSKPAEPLTPFGIALASALAAALAPALAESLAPAIVQALSHMAEAEKEKLSQSKSGQEKLGQEKSEQESASAEGSEKSEHRQ